MWLQESLPSTCRTPCPRLWVPSPFPLTSNLPIWWHPLLRLFSPFGYSISLYSISHILINLRHVSLCNPLSPQGSKSYLLHPQLSQYPLVSFSGFSSIIIHPFTFVFTQFSHSFASALLIPCIDKSHIHAWPNNRSEIIIITPSWSPTCSANSQTIVIVYSQSPACSVKSWFYHLTRMPCNHQPLSCWHYFQSSSHPPNPGPTWWHWWALWELSWIIYLNPQ